MERKECVSYGDLFMLLTCLTNSERVSVPSFSVHPDELQDSTKKKLNDRGYFYANSNAGLGWTDRANREAFYKWRIVPRTCVDTNTRDLTGGLNPLLVLKS